MAQENLPTPTESVLTDHVYDGIMEFDNPTPGWWHLIFFGTIVFSLLYFPIYHFSPFVPSPQQAVAERSQREMQKRFGSLASIPLDNDKMLMLMTDEKWLDAGKAIYSTRCALCHGVSGEGLVGPNMTDDYYKNVRTLTDFVTVVTDGAANGLMPPQKSLLNAGQIEVVSAYVATMRGANIPGRQPEGDLIDSWPEIQRAKTPD